MARIAIEFTPAVTQGGGVARSVHEMTAALLAASRHDYTLFIAGDSPLPVDIDRFNPNVRRSPVSSIMLTRLWHRLRLPLPVETFTGQQDLFFATDFALPPLKRRTRSAVFIHDLTYVRVPEAAVPSLVAYLGAVVPRSIQRADVVIVNSEATKADIVETYGTPPDKVIPVQFGVHKRFAPSNVPLGVLRDKYSLPDGSYLLAVGTIQPRKNYARLISALRQLREGGMEISLVIAGGRGWLDSPIYASVQAGKLEPYVKFLGYVDDWDLPALYSHAEVFVMPSLYEGFGLPVLEAMACRVPVVTSNVSSLPEAAGDSALLVDPLDVDALTHALRRVLDDSELRKSMIERGILRAADFIWERTAAQLADAFELALS